MTLRLCAILAILFPALAFAQADPPQQAPTKPGEYIFKYVARIDGKPRKDRTSVGFYLAPGGQPASRARLIASAVAVPGPMVRRAMASRVVL